MKTSLTLVPVGPVTNSPPDALKKLYASLRVNAVAALTPALSPSATVRRRRECARGVGRPVDSVGPREQRLNSFSLPAPDLRQLDSHRERALLGASALSSSAHRHDRLAARHDAHALISDLT